MPDGRNQWGCVSQQVLHRPGWPILHYVSILWPQGPGGSGRSLAAAVQKDDREKRQCAQAAMMRHARFGATLVHRTAGRAGMRCTKVAQVPAAPAVPGNVARNAKHHVILSINDDGMLLGKKHLSALYALQGQGCGTWTKISTAARNPLRV